MLNFVIAGNFSEEIIPIEPPLLPKPSEVITFMTNWDLLVNNVLDIEHFTLTLASTVKVTVEQSVKVVVFDGSGGAELVVKGDKCMLNPLLCDNGLTYKLRLKLTVLEENTYFFTTGGDLEDSYGLAFFYKFGKFHYIVSTATQIWYAESTVTVKLNKWFEVAISWHASGGLKVLINGTKVAHTLSYVNRTVTITQSVTTLYLGYSANTTTSIVYAQFYLEYISFYYVTYEYISGKIH